MKLVVDVMGFENDIIEAINASIDFLSTHNDVEIILVGDKNIIEKKLIDLNTKYKFDIIHAPDVIKMTDNPIMGLRKTNSSMYKAIEVVANNQADGVLSAGNTSCYVLMLQYLIKLITGIHKLAFMPYVPSSTGHGFNMLDVGANKECSGEDLYQFAKMANIYCKKNRNISNPKIGVINIGTEDNKGFDFQQKAHELLKNDRSLNYVGFVEPRYLLNSVVDIAICDGYTGNITLKSLEGGLLALKSVLKKEFKKPWNFLASILSLGIFKNIKRTFDYRNNAGALVIGLNKIAVKTHGSADKQQFYSSLQMLYKSVKNNIINEIKQKTNE